MRLNAPARLLGVLFAVSVLSGCPEGSPTKVESDQVADVSDTVANDTVADLSDIAPIEDTNTEPDFTGSCKAGDTACIEGKLAVCDGQYGWLLENCPEGTACFEGECVQPTCTPLEAKCGDGGVQICSPEGTTWSDPMPCPAGQKCKGGMCIPESCEPGSKECMEDKILECNADGTDVIIKECPEGQICFSGECIECIKDVDCAEGLECKNGFCQGPELVITTQALPDGMVGTPYTVTFEATGGETPYTWSFEEANLAAGLTLDAGAATLSGTPSAAGDFSLKAVVTDTAGTKAEKVFSFTIHAAGGNVVITTGSPLPQGEEGTPYSVTFAASGGLTPYTWGMVGGELPAGLSLSSSGVLAGTPEAHGDFTFTIKVFDNSSPVGTGTKEFTMNLKIAPLEIIGDQQYDLWVAKIIILPLITAVQGIPLPYNAQLQAIGGVKPYHWTEQPLPSYVSFLIPNGGLPQGLTLDESGSLHGSVTDPSQAVSVSVPFTQISLTGFFFVGQVEDSQNPADSASAIYLIPTLPVSF